ncbi:TetR/AcrR family transcriptional regulator [Nonomuraea helvata]|uniref:TetR/AcrR family transcriptional regulator n=1 Tax=Nonomuraea helvata TaxID=37484 RepID=A0ABV5S9V1_9ACTN
METRRPGRPRSETADQAIIDATLQVVSEVGYEAASLELIAQRAGVGTATIYRRFKRKSGLVAAALAKSAEALRPPTTGAMRSDLAELMRELWAGWEKRPVARVLAAVALSEPELLQIGWQVLAGPHQEVVAAVAREGIARGELREDLDVEVLVDLLCAIPSWLGLMRPDAEFTPELALRFADTILRGAASPLRTRKE